MYAYLMLISTFLLPTQTASYPFSGPRITLGFRQEWDRKEAIIRFRTPAFFIHFGLQPDNDNIYTDYDTTVEIALAPKKQPKLQEKWRFGIAIESNRMDPLFPQEDRWNLVLEEASDLFSPAPRNYVDQRFFQAYFLIRREFPNFTTKIYLPLARIHQGRRWPFRFRVEDLRIYLFRHPKDSLAIIGLIDYRSDNGLRTATV